MALAILVHMLRMGQTPCRHTGFQRTGFVPKILGTGLFVMVGYLMAGFPQDIFTRVFVYIEKRPVYIEYFITSGIQEHNGV